MFEIGATYNRRKDIHERFGGQRQGGISTPSNGEFIFLFTGAAGEKYGYHDEITEEGFHLFGEGQVDDMTFVRGNRAIRDHVATKKRLLLFQASGRGKHYVYRGEYRLLRWEERMGVPDITGSPRKAIVFVLQHVATDEGALLCRADLELSLKNAPVEETTRLRTISVRTKQVLFRERVELLEKGCRVTRITDGRFLRASHIKPWAVCSDEERVDGSNGLLLTPHIDHLFDGGWLTFDDYGSLLMSEALPSDIIERFALNDARRIRADAFLETQRTYLQYHREYIFRKAASVKS